MCIASFIHSGLSLCNWSPSSCLASIDIAFLLSTGRIFVNLFFPFCFIWACTHSQRQKSLILQTHSKPNSGRPYLKKNKTKLCLPQVHSGKTLQCHFFFVFVAHCHNWTQPHCLVLNLSHIHSHTHNQDTETCSLLFSHFFSLFVFWFSCVLQLIPFVSDI